MKIAYVLPSLINKGPVIVARDLVQEMVHKADCIVFYFDDAQELDFPCPVVRIRNANEIPLDDFDIIHTHMLRPDVLLARRRKLAHKARFVSTIHSYMAKDLRNSYGAFIAFVARKIWCRMLRRFDRVVCLSRDMQAYYSTQIPSEKLTYIYNGRTSTLPSESTVHADDHAKIAAIKSKYRLIGGIGNLTPIKGFEQLVEAVGKDQELALLIIGEGPEKERLMKQAKEAGAEDRCLFLGYRQNAKEYYRYFDIYGVTSFSEGFPLVLLEAAGFGLPVVCSDLAIFKEILTSEEVSFYKLYDIDDLLRAIRIALQNREKLSGNIRKAYEANYTAAHMGERYFSLYKTLAKKG